MKRWQKYLNKTLCKGVERGGYIAHSGAAPVRQIGRQTHSARMIVGYAYR
jgi:hypothetical protein